MRSFAVLKNGQVISIVMCSSLEQARTSANQMDGGPYEVRLLDEIPLTTKQQYEYWHERP